MVIHIFILVIYKRSILKEEFYKDVMVYILNKIKKNVLEIGDDKVKVKIHKD